MEKIEKFQLILSCAIITLGILLSSLVFSSITIFNRCKISFLRLLNCFLDSLGFKFAKSRFFFIL